MNSIDSGGLAVFSQRARLDYSADCCAKAEQPMQRQADAEKAAEHMLRYQSTEKSVLKIRTQEGDTVMLRIRVAESAQMTTSKTGDSETEVATTTLAARSSTKLSLKIKGDLNADEMAAIQSVFEQAAELADEFFSGDYAAAFDYASGLEIDALQLAKVSLRLKIRESMTYTGSGLPPVLLGAPPQNESAPAAIAQPATTGDSAAAPQPATVTEAPVPAAAESAAEEAIDPVVAPVTVETPLATEPESDESAGTPSSISASGFWFSAVLEFVGRLFETFDDVSQPENSTEDTQPQSSDIDLSLKLRLFSLMLVEISSTEVGSSEESEKAVPALVPETIEAIATEQDAPLDAVA